MAGNDAWPTRWSRPWCRRGVSGRALRQPVVASRSRAARRWNWLAESAAGARWARSGGNGTARTRWTTRRLRWNPGLSGRPVAATGGAGGKRDRPDHAPGPRPAGAGRCGRDRAAGVCQPHGRRGAEADGVRLSRRDQRLCGRRGGAGRRAAAGVPSDLCDRRRAAPGCRARPASGSGAGAPIVVQRLPLGREHLPGGVGARGGRGPAGRRAGLSRDVRRSLCCGDVALVRDDAARRVGWRGLGRDAGGAAVRDVRRHAEPRASDRAGRMDVLADLPRARTRRWPRAWRCRWT